MNIMNTIRSADNTSPQLPGLVEAVSDFATDVTLVAAGGKKVGAHSLICAAISPVLRRCLTGGFMESASKVVNLDYATAETIRNMLSFAVGSLAEERISGNEAVELVLLADRLDYGPLKEACSRVLLSLLTSENAADLFACASESNSTQLVQMAKAVLDTGSISGSVRVLVDKKRLLEVQRTTCAKRQDEARDALYGIERQIMDLAKQIDHEAEEVYQQTVTSVPQDAVGPFSEDAHPYYPHTPKRTLVALTPDILGFTSTVQKREALRKQFESFEPYVYECFNDALEAALPGDAIVLAKGTHNPSSCSIKKSLQIIGTEKGVVIHASLMSSESIFSVVGVDVFIRNVEFHTSATPVVVRQGGNLWFEGCRICPYEPLIGKMMDGEPDAGIVVAPDSSAYIKRCKIDATSVSAVLAHPLAKNISISDCTFRGSGSGEKGGGVRTVRIVQGEAGSVEICDFPFHTGEEEDGYADGTPARVKLTLVRTSIASCFGPALSYRTRHSKTPSQNFSWPGTSSVIMRGNVFQNNGLARENGSAPDGSAPDGEAIVFNDFPECFDRDPGMFAADMFRQSNYRSFRNTRRF